MNPSIYAIYDTVAQAIVGNMLTIHRVPAAAFRMFSEVLSNTTNDLGKRPEDYNLLCLADIQTPTGDHRLPLIDLSAYPAPQIVMTGAAWKAAQQPRGELRLDNSNQER